MTELIQIIGALGIGALVSNYLTVRWEKKKEDQRKHQEYKETRYKCITLLMRAYLNYEQYALTLKKHGYNINSDEDLAGLLQDELVNSYLFASNAFIEEFAQFLDKPNNEHLLGTVKEIRKDLWGLK